MEKQIKVLSVPPRGRAEPAQPNLGEQVPYGDPVYNAIMGFLIEEAASLDENDMKRWLSMLSSDILYTMPLRQTVNRDLGRGFYPAMNWVYDDLASITFKLKRITTSDSAFAEDPPSRCRRFISNLRLFETDKAEEYFARSYILLRRARGDASHTDEVSALREDVIRRHGPGYQIARRTVLADHTVLGMSNFAVYL